MELNWNDQALRSYGFNEDEIKRLKTEASKMSPDDLKYFRDQGWLSGGKQQEKGPVSVPRNGSPQDVQPTQRMQETPIDRNQISWNDQALRDYGFNPKEMERLKTEAQNMSPDSLKYFVDQGWINPPQQEQPQAQAPVEEPIQQGQSQPVVVPQGGSPQNVQPLQLPTQLQAPTPNQPQMKLQMPEGMNQALNIPEQQKTETANVQPVQSNAGTETQPMPDRLFSEEDYAQYTQMAPEMAEVYKSWIGKPYSEIEGKTKEALAVSAGLPALAVGAGALGASGIGSALANTLRGVLGTGAASQYASRAGDYVRSLPSAMRSLPSNVVGELPPAPPGGIMQGSQGWYMLP